MDRDDTASANASGVPVGAGPVAAAERIASLDTLRGVAVLGILVMNIYWFAMPTLAYSDPLAMGGTELHNLGTWFVTHSLFDLKFMAIFAMLFGAGLVLMSRRAAERAAPFGRIYFRRQLWLLLLGMIHAYLLWSGDILFGYAVVGMAVYPLRNARPRTLVIASALLLAITAAASHGISYPLEEMRNKAAEYTALQAAGEELDPGQRRLVEQWEQTRRFLAPGEREKQRDLEAHLGSYADILEFRVPRVIGMQQGMLLFYSWRIAGLMCLGMALMKLGILSAARPAAFYRRLMLFGYGLGLPLTVFSGLDLYAHGFERFYTMRYGMLTNYVGSIIVALGHVGLVMLILKTGFVRGLTGRFAAVGRTALSNYLLHSIILTTVFYGYGLGLYGKVPRFWQMGFVLAVVGLQLLLSPWWLERYRFGPLEWAWRSLTYWRRQPMRRRAGA
jgi:uncharacterized protein